MQAELSECKRNPKVLDLERELELKKGEVDSLVSKVGLLESEKVSLTQQLVSLTSGIESEVPNAPASSHNLEMEVVELRRLNKELQLQKRNLSCRLSSMESRVATPLKVSEVVSQSHMLISHFSNLILFFYSLYCLLRKSRT